MQKLFEPKALTTAVYGVLSWITTLPRTVRLGAQHNAAIAADLASAYCEHNGFPEDVDTEAYPFSGPGEKAIRNIVFPPPPTQKLQVGHRDDGNVYVSLDPEQPAIAMSARSAVLFAQSLIKHATAAEVLAQGKAPRIWKPR